MTKGPTQPALTLKMVKAVKPSSTRHDFIRFRLSKRQHGWERCSCGTSNKQAKNCHGKRGPIND